MEFNCLIWKDNYNVYLDWDLPTSPSKWHIQVVNLWDGSSAQELTSCSKTRPTNSQLQLSCFLPDASWTLNFSCSRTIRSNMQNKSVTATLLVVEKSHYILRRDRGQAYIKTQHQCEWREEEDGKASCSTTETPPAPVVPGSEACFHMWSLTQAQLWHAG